MEKWILSQSCGRVDRKENMVSIKVVTKVAESMKRMLFEAWWVRLYEILKHNSKMVSFSTTRLRIQGMLLYMGTKRLVALQNDDEEISIVAEWLYNAWGKVLVFMD